MAYQYQRMLRGLYCVALVAWGLSISSHAVGDVQISEQARKHFRTGVSLLKDPGGARFEEAYRAFRAAYRASPSPKILGNLGLCAMNLERDGEAIAAYSKYLQQVADIAQAEREQIEKDLEVLKTNVVWLTLTVTPVDAQIVDERTPVRANRIVNRYEIEQGKLKIGIRAGHHRVTVERTGFASQSWNFEATPGVPIERTVTLSPQPTTVPPVGTDIPVGPTDGPDAVERPTPTSVYVMIGVTAALGVTTAILGGVALSNSSKFDDAVEAEETAEAEDLRDKGVGLNIATDVMLGTTAAAAVVTLVLYLTRPEVPVSSAEGGFGDRWSFAPAVGQASGGLVFSASF